MLRRSRCLTRFVAWPDGRRDRSSRAATLTALGPVAQLGSAAPWHGEGRGFKSRQVHVLPGWPGVFDSLGHLLGGIVAGEGCFRSTERRERFSDGTARVRFVFEMSMTIGDRPILEALQAVLGAGSIQDRGSRRPGWRPECRLTIASESAHLRSTIPFGEEYLASCEKRRQFEAWRDALYAYRARRPTRFGAGPSSCSVEGCDGVVRGRGLCRHHYYEATGW